MELKLERELNSHGDEANKKKEVKIKRKSGDRTGDIVTTVTEHSTEDQGVVHIKRVSQE